MNASPVGRRPTRRLRVALLLLLLLPVAEVAVAVRVGLWLGAGTTILALVLLSVLGAGVIRRAGAGLRPEPATGRPSASMTVPRQAGRTVVRLLAGALLFVPGFLTGLVGLVLLIPPVADLVLSRAGRRLDRLTTATWRRMGGPGGSAGGSAGWWSGWSGGGAVVTGEVVEPPGQAGPSGDPDGVVRGEVLGPGTDDGRPPAR